MDIQVILTNQTPVFSAAPGSAAVDINGNLVNEGFPLIRARTLSVVADEGDGVLKARRLPVVPGNSMRNLLRRIMLKHIIEPSLKDRVQVSIGAYAGMYAGNASGNPDGVAATFDEIVAVRNHPFLGLFGGGPRMMQGRLMVDTLYPIHTHAQRIIGEGFEDRMIGDRIVDLVWTRRVDPVTKLNDTEDTGIIKDGVKAANDWIRALAEGSAAKADKKKAKKAEATEAGDGDTEKAARGLNGFNAHEVVIPGVSWVWRINADNPTEAQIGLILAALSKLPLERLAGGGNKDYGRVVVDDIRLNGNSVWGGGQLNEQSVTAYMDALAEAMDNLDAEGFENFITSQKG